MKKILDFLKKHPLSEAFVFSYIVLLFFPYAVFGFEIPKDISIKDFVQFMIGYSLFLAFIVFYLYLMIADMGKRY